MSRGEPSTEAGRRLLDGWWPTHSVRREQITALVLEIEAEARQQGRHNLPDSVANNAYLASTNDANNGTDASQQGRDRDAETFRRTVIAVLTENKWGVYEAGSHVWVDRRRFADDLRAALDAGPQVRGGG